MHSGRQKTCWSLATPKEQMEFWDLERAILKHVAREHAPHISLLRWKRTAFENIVQQWQEVA